IPKLFGSTRSNFRSDHLGFAAATEDGGVVATIFYDRIQSVGQGGDLSGMLGLAIAHELGHLLLGSKAHTPAGIMQPRWTRKDLQRRQPNVFGFNPDQGERMRKVADRITGYGPSTPQSAPYVSLHNNKGNNDND
ncbi:MAG: hypothetical protein ACRD2L_23695, partial [Terriglobia bacterium]